MTRGELYAAVVAERFPPLAVVERERPPTPAEYERRRRVLVEALEGAPRGERSHRAPREKAA